MNDDKVEMDNTTYFEQIMQAATQLREVLQNEEREIDEHSPFRFMATAPIYLSWILDDLIAILMMSAIPRSAGSKPRHHIKATRMLLCILEESNLHARVARDILDTLMVDDSEDEPSEEEA